MMIFEVLEVFAIVAVCYLCYQVGRQARQAELDVLRERLNKKAGAVNSGNN